MSATKPAGSSYIYRHWRGELPLGISFWLNGFALHLVHGILFSAVALGLVLTVVNGNNPRNRPPSVTVSILLAMTCFSLAVYIWQVVGIWRSSGQPINERKRLQIGAPWAVMARIVIIVLPFLAIVSVPLREYASSHAARMPDWMQELVFSKQHLLGTFGNWMVTSGEAVDGSGYCSIVSLQAAQGGTVALRVLRDSPRVVEWLVFPSVTAPGETLSEVEAKKIILAQLAPPSVGRFGESIVQGIASIGNQSPFPVPFSLIRVGGSDELRARYWWLVQLDSLSGFERAADWVIQSPQMRIALRNTRLSDVVIAMRGFPAALAAMKRCAD